MLRQIFCLLFLVASTYADCQEENVSLDGQVSSTSAAKSPADCQKTCDGTRCGHWVWKNGQCNLIRIADPGRKVGMPGAVTGTKTGGSCPLLATGIQCHYTQSRTPVACIFPFIGKTPGDKAASDQHDSCLKTKRGKFWCATKLSIDNKLLATSDQTKDIDCGIATNKQGVFLCLSTASCPSVTSVQQRIADLERKNRELEAKLKTGACAKGQDDWGQWTTWTKCSKTCNGEQTRRRTCPRGKTCTGQAMDKRSCGGSCGGPTGAATSSRGASANSCAGRCDKTAGLGQCQCSSTCFSFGDCCPDYAATCGAQNPNSCAGKCGNRFDRKQSCQCNLDCGDFKNCCSDFAKTCKSGAQPTPTRSPSTAAVRPATAADPVLGAFTEKLLSLEENNVRDKITIDAGCTTRVGNKRDCSPKPLFTRVDTSIFRKPVYAKLMAMYENYVPDTLTVEDNTNAERNEEDAFLNEILKTKVMKETLSFLKQKKYVKTNLSEAEFKKMLKELWFGIYSRGMRIKGSSGFEHVFLGEKKQGSVQGFHNWVYFYHLEKSNQVNYLGHWENVDLGGKGNGLSFTFTWGKEQKPFASMVVGTSPELEMALYTTCLLAKGENKCSISLGGKLVDVEIHVFTRPGGVKYIASSFMDW